MVRFARIKKECSVPKERTREPNKKGQVRKLSDYLKATGQSPVTGNDREETAWTRNRQI